MKVYGVVNREYNSPDDLKIFSTPQAAYQYFCFCMYRWSDWAEPYDRICQQFRWNEELEELEFYYSEDGWDTWDDDCYYDIIWYEVRPLHNKRKEV